VKTPALFLDRDGVINRDVGYAFTPEQIEWMPDVFTAVRVANQAGFFVFVVTNQSGVARGLYSEKNVRDLHEWMGHELKKQGAEVKEFSYCPHHPSEGQGAHKTECACRKPKPGMITALCEAYTIDLARSFLIGDMATDIAAAEAAGIRGCLFTGDNLLGLVQDGVRG
jgi:D-glycero-D-manno-heptose 1,7-bisphosphate phosphatase